MKRLLSLVTILAILFSFCAVAEEAPTSITIGLTLSSNVENYDTNAFTLYLEDQFNVDIQFMLMDNMIEKLPVMVASRAELPDIICGSLGTTTTWNFAKQEALIPLTQYFNNPEMTVNFDAEVAQLDNPEELRKNILAQVTMPDGEIYSMPKYDEVLWTLMGSYHAFINVKWLEALELDMPETTDELVEVLKHFVNDDPNGNGKKDELGIVSCVSGSEYGGFVWAMNSFLYCTPDNDYFNVEDGVIYPAFVKDEFRDGLEFCKQLVDEGLYSVESLIINTTQMRALINGEDPLVGIVLSMSESNFTTPERKAEYTILGPMMGPDGAQFTASKPATVIGVGYITKYAENPELCFKILESQYEFTMRRNFRNGPEGVCWSVDPEVCALYKGNMGTKPTLAIVKNVWGKVNNYIWGIECMPFFNTNKFTVTQATTLETEENKDQRSNSDLNYLRYIDYVPEEMLGTLIYTDDENERLAMISPVINSYVSENMAAFVTGDRSLDEWDAYINTLYDMHLQEYVDIQQAAYDRMYK